MAQSEKQRLMQAKKRAELKKKMNKIDGFVGSLQKQKTSYLEKAKDAKARGEKATYSLAKAGLNNTVSQLKRAKEMQLNLEITSELKEMSISGADFLQTMGTLAKRISKLNKSTNFKKLNKSINAAIEGMQKTGMGLDAVMESTQSSFESIAAISGGLSDAQLDSFIDGEITERELTADPVSAAARASAGARVGVSTASKGGVGGKSSRSDVWANDKDDDGGNA